MPWYTFSEVWTPLKLIGIRFFKEAGNNEIWIKAWSRNRKPIFRNRD